MECCLHDEYDCFVARRGGRKTALSVFLFDLIGIELGFWVFDDLKLDQLPPFGFVTLSLSRAVGAVFKS